MVDIAGLKEQIPFYLTQRQGEGLLKQLKNLNPATELYLRREIDGLLQGDGWRGLVFYDHDSSKLRTVRGIILSNSCDIDPANKREMPPLVTFGPIWKLSRIEHVFREAGIADEAVNAKIEAIKQQKITQFFYLPNQGVLEEDCVVWLSNAQSVPLQTFLTNSSKGKVFTLNMFGFYLFVFKLSIHFCRFHEAVNRYDDGQALATL